MGIIKRGILGGFSNKVANVVGSSWKGIAVIKSLPLSVANPNTAAQQSQRNKFSACVLFAGTILTTVIKPCWDRWAQRMSGYNAFVQTNIDFFSSAGLITPASLITARGSLVGVVNLAAQADASLGTITINWDDNSGSGNAAASDDAYAVVYNFTTQELIQAGPGLARNDGQIDVTGLTLVVGQVIWVYLAFRQTSGFLVSDSSAVSCTVVA